MCASFIRSEEGTFRMPAKQRSAESGRSGCARAEKLEEMRIERAFLRLAIASDMTTDNDAIIAHDNRRKQARHARLDDPPRNHIKTREKFFVIPVVFAEVKAVSAIDLGINQARSKDIAAEVDDRLGARALLAKIECTLRVEDDSASRIDPEVSGLEDTLVIEEQAVRKAEEAVVVRVGHGGRWKERSMYRPESLYGSWVRVKEPHGTLCCRRTLTIVSWRSAIRNRSLRWHSQSRMKPSMCDFSAHYRLIPARGAYAVFQ